MICPLHDHSHFSSLDGLSTPAEIAQRSVEIETFACGLTDHGVVAGHLEFAKEMEKVGVKPIFGVEAYHGTHRGSFKGRGNVRDQAHLILLAMTDEGLRNIWRLTDLTANADSFHNVGRMFWEDLEAHSEGVVATSACALGLVPKGLMKGDYEPLNRYLDIYGDNFHIEIHTYPWDKDFNDRDADGEPINMRIINEALVQVAQERGIPMVYANDAHYANHAQYEQHDMYLALQTGQSVYTPIEDRTMWHPEGALAIMDETEVRKALDYLPDSVVDEAIANSVVLGERAAAALPEIKRHMPTFIPGDCPWLEPEQAELSAEDLFIELVHQGIERRYGSDPSAEVWERVVYEVETLLADGIHHYFLMGWDEAMFADIEGITRGPGRGSSAGCIVAYALGITDVDPLHYGLIFERFWNSGRADGFPDIDSDFAISGRPKVIEYLKDRWGHDMVCAIGTVGRMKPKATIDRLWRACGISQTDAIELKDIVGKTKDIEIHGVDQIGWSRELEPGKVSYVEECVGDEIEKWIGGHDLRRRFVNMCRMTCSRVQLYGIHPSGVAISDVRLADELPAYLRGGKAGVPATQFDMEDVDKRYFIKLDVLGLRTLDTTDRWKELMAEKGIEIEWSGLDLQDHPLEMWEMLQRGFAAGIFQVESGYPKRLCELMQARTVEDLALIVALNRPGPIGDGIPDHYIARRHGDEKVTYPHERFKELMYPYLDATYGLFVYQEQVINYFNVLDYTLSESDAVRKILGKKKPEQLAALHNGEGEWEGRGYVEMAHSAGIPEKYAEPIWDGLERFASYSFNKSHAVCYGCIGFRTLFAKYYGPAQFYAACVGTVDGEKRKEMLPLYVNEAHRLDIDVRPPSVHHSKGLATVEEDGSVRFGYADVKGVGRDSADYMASLLNDSSWDIESPEAFYDAFEEYNKAYLKEKKAQKLVGDGILIVQNPPVLDTKSPKQKLGAGKIEAIFNAGAWDETDDRHLTMRQKQEFEDELLGVILTDNTKEAFLNNAEEIAECDSYYELLRPFAEKAEGFELDLEDDKVGLRYDVCGIVVSAEEKRGRKSGKSFGIVTVEYGPDTVEFIVFNSKWRSNKFLFRIRTPGIFTLKHTPATEYGESYQFLKGQILR